MKGKQYPGMEFEGQSSSGWVGDPDLNYQAARVGVFVDIPNLVRGAATVGGEFDPQAVFEAAKARGEVVVANAYVARYWGIKPTQASVESIRVGFDVIERVQSEEQQKDIDTWMLADILNALYTDQIDLLMIVSGDSDFCPAAVIAKRLGKRVVVVSFQECLGRHLVEEADGLVLLTGPTRRTKVVEARGGCAQSIGARKVHA